VGERKLQVPDIRIGHPMGNDDGAWRAAAENGWVASHSGVAGFPLDPIDRLVV
jgi:hypothetical protein